MKIIIKNKKQTLKVEWGDKAKIFERKFLARLLVSYGILSECQQQ